MRNKIQASTKGRIFHPRMSVPSACGRQPAGPASDNLHTRCPASESRVLASHWAIVWWAICRRRKELGCSSVPPPSGLAVCLLNQIFCGQLTLASQVSVCSLMPVPERRTRHPSIPNSAPSCFFPRARLSCALPRGLAGTDIPTCRPDPWAVWFLMGACNAVRRLVSREYPSPPVVRG